MSHARLPLGAAGGGVSPSATQVRGSEPPADRPVSAAVTAGDPGDLMKLQEQRPGPFSLFVGDLAFEASGEALEALFTSRFPSVVEAYVISDRATTRSRGYGFVRLSDIDQAQQAISAMNGQLFMGRRIRVSAAGPKPAQGARLSLSPTLRPASAAMDPIWSARPGVVAMPQPPRSAARGSASAQVPSVPLTGPARPQFRSPAVSPAMGVVSVVGCNAHTGTLVVAAAGVRLSWLVARAEIVGEVSARLHRWCGKSMLTG